MAKDENWRDEAKMLHVYEYYKSSCLTTEEALAADKKIQ